MIFTRMCKILLLGLMCCVVSTVYAQETVEEPSLKFEQQAEPQPVELHSEAPTAPVPVVPEPLAPKSIYQNLVEGNQRFIKGEFTTKELKSNSFATAMMQSPQAVILNCVDSRTPATALFDQEVSDILAIRIVGNVVDEDVLGSMEYGTQIAGAKLIAVIGHTNCGAIKSACEQVKLGNLTELLKKIEPAVKQATKEQGPHNCADADYRNLIAKENVIFMMRQIVARSPVIKKLLGDGEIGLVGGMQDLATGKVTFFEDENIIPKEKA